MQPRTPFAALPVGMLAVTGSRHLPSGVSLTCPGSVNGHRRHCSVVVRMDTLWRVLGLRTPHCQICAGHGEDAMGCCCILPREDCWAYGMSSCCICCLLLHLSIHMYLPPNQSTCKCIHDCFAAWIHVRKSLWCQLNPHPPSPLLYTATLQEKA
jgi:hypothetical protein